MKKIIIFSISALLVVAIGFAVNYFVSDYIAASGPGEDITPLIMVNDQLFETNSSCAQSAFDNIVGAQGFTLSELKIAKAIKSDKTPTENLSTNFKLFAKQEMYLSENRPDEIYIKTVVDNEVRYYLFTPATTSVDPV